MGPNHYRDFLRIVLETHSRTLESLELEAIDGIGPRLNMNEIIGDSTIFAFVRHLYLCRVNLDGAYMKMTSAFCMQELRSLKLRHCYGAAQFLRMLKSLSPSLKLRSFELEFNERARSRNRLWEEHFLEAFLYSFQGLKELFISIQNPIYHKSVYFMPVFHHQRSLRRLVYHVREMDLNTSSSRHKQTRDSQLPWKRLVKRVWRGPMDLDCFAFSMSPYVLVTIV